MTNETLSETVRVRLQPSLKQRLEKAAGREQRSPSAVARRGIERELDRLETRQTRKG